MKKIFHSQILLEFFKYLQNVAHQRSEQCLLAVPDSQKSFGFSVILTL